MSHICDNMKCVSVQRKCLQSKYLLFVSFCFSCARCVHNTYLLYSCNSAVGGGQDSFYVTSVLKTKWKMSKCPIEEENFVQFHLQSCKYIYYNCELITNEFDIWHFQCCELYSFCAPICSTDFVQSTTYTLRTPSNTLVYTLFYVTDPTRKEIAHIYRCTRCVCACACSFSIRKRPLVADHWFVYALRSFDVIEVARHRMDFYRILYVEPQAYGNLCM